MEIYHNHPFRLLSSVTCQENMASTCLLEMLGELGKAIYRSNASLVSETQMPTTSNIVDIVTNVPEFTMTFSETRPWTLFMEKYIVFVWKWMNGIMICEG